MFGYWIKRISVLMNSLVTEQNKDRENRFREVGVDQFDFKYIAVKSVIVKKSAL